MRIIWLMPDRQMNGVVSHEEGVKLAVNAKADEIGAKAEARLAAVRAGGRYSEGASSIEVEYRIDPVVAENPYGDLDAVVWLVDEPHQREDGTWSEGDPLAIEFGHIHNWTGQYVEGKYIITGAAGIAG